MKTKGQGGFLDEILHHTQTLDQTQGLGKAYYDTILSFVNTCQEFTRSAEENKNDNLASFWEEIKDDVIEQYQSFLKSMDEEITFGAYMKINPKPSIDQEIEPMDLEPFDFRKPLEKKVMKKLICH